MLINGIEYECQKCENWIPTEKDYGVCCLLGISPVKDFFCADFEEKDVKCLSVDKGFKV